MVLMKKLNLHICFYNRFLSNKVVFNIGSKWMGKNQVGIDVPRHMFGFVYDKLSHMTT